jgi:hypothetical protein
MIHKSLSQWIAGQPSVVPVSETGRPRGQLPGGTQEVVSGVQRPGPNNH